MKRDEDLNQYWNRFWKSEHRKNWIKKIDRDSKEIHLDEFFKIFKILLVLRVHFNFFGEKCFLWKTGGHNRETMKEINKDVKNKKKTAYAS